MAVARVRPRVRAGRIALAALGLGADVALRPAATLSDWPGALAVATHDRRLRNALRLDRVVEL